jgi:hypothetical protein
MCGRISPPPSAAASGVVSQSLHRCPSHGPLHFLEGLWKNYEARLGTASPRRYPRSTFRHCDIFTGGPGEREPS